MGKKQEYGQQAKKKREKRKETRNDAERKTEVSRTLMDGGTCNAAFPSYFWFLFNQLVVVNIVGGTVMHTGQRKEEEGC